MNTVEGERIRMDPDTQMIDYITVGLPPGSSDILYRRMPKDAP